MLYSEFISKAKQIAIIVDDVTNMAYVIPDYRYLLYLSKLDISDVSDFPAINWDIVKDNLELEAKAYNACHNKSYTVLETIELMLNGYQYAVSQEGTKLLIEQQEPKEEKKKVVPDNISDLKNVMNFTRKKT